MKYALFLTHRCNLACTYCYVSKGVQRMPFETARAAVDFAYHNTPDSDPVDFGFFGGEPLLEFGLLQEITRYVRAHPRFDPCRVHLGMATNGTLLDDNILEFLTRNEIQTTISCDGPPTVQDRFRLFVDGGRTSARVEHGIRLAQRHLRYVPVNAVYRPETLTQLPESLAYFSSLGLRHIYLNPDYSAAWSRTDLDLLPDVYHEVGEMYKSWYRAGQAHYISLIDIKITVMLRGGYAPSERCGMGRREFAFTADGHVLPCERLASADVTQHTIGRVNGLVNIGPLRDHFDAADGAPCPTCSLEPYCSHWCGCSNYMMTGAYNRVGPMLCASERASIAVAFEVFQQLEEELGPTFVDHLGGRAQTRTVWDVPAATTV